MAYRLSKGARVKWNDPAINEYPAEERDAQMSRVYKVVKYLSEDTVLIEDEYGEVEVYPHELLIEDGDCFCPHEHCCRNFYPCICDEWCKFEY